MLFFCGCDISQNFLIAKDPGKDTADTGIVITDFFTGKGKVSLNRKPFSMFSRTPQEHPENLNVHLLLIIRLIFNSTTITFFNIVWDTPSITVTAILYFTSISIFSGGLAKSLSISFSSTPAIFSIVSLDMP